MENIFITPQVIDYYNSNKGSFNGITPKVNDVWKIKRVVMYPGVNYGEPVIEIERGNEWMRLPANIFYSKNYAEYLSEKYHKE